MIYKKDRILYTPHVHVTDFSKNNEIEVSLLDFSIVNVKKKTNNAKIKEIYIISYIFICLPTSVFISIFILFYTISASANLYSIIFRIICTRKTCFYNRMSIYFDLHDIYSTLG